MQRTLYQLLGVSETATDEQLSEAYARLESRLRARADGGDVEAGNQLKFAHEAFSILRNAESRKQYDLKQSAKRVVTEIAGGPVNATSSVVDAAELAPQSKFEMLARHVGDSLRWHTRTLVVSVVAGVILLTTAWHFLPTEAHRLKSRAEQFYRLGETMNYEAMYEFLPPDLRREISREAFIKWNSQQTATPAEVVSVEVTEPSSRGYAVIKRVSEPPGDNARKRVAWVMADGKWYRDLSSDASDSVKQMGRISGLVTAVGESPVSFELEDLETKWFYNQTGRTEKERFAVWPETAFFVRNTGKDAIDYLEIMVEYYDTKENGVFASDTAYVVGSSDRPLQPGERSALTNMKSTVRYEMDFGQFASTLMAGPLGKDNPAIQRIEVRIYAKESAGSQWVRIP